MKRNYLLTVAATVIVTLPGVLARLAGIECSPHVTALISGLAIVGASFLLLWACDAAQQEISQALALAAVALMAVLPEYSVDMYFTWQAGRYPAGDYAHFAIANMTGANRLLIGVAWGLIVALFWVRFRRDVWIESERRTELFFLALASLYAFVIPLKGSLEWYDGVVLLAIYICYLVVAGRRSCGECEVEGPAELIARLPRTERRLAIVGMFLFAGGVILANAEPFCEGLVATGKAFQISEFLLVQWVAPLASEAPEFIVALMFAWRGQAGLALGSLLSAKLNQWTLLVGMIPGVFAISHGSLDHPLPMGHFQMSELLLTAAQSVLGVVLLAGLRLSIGGAMLLFGLFFGQFVLPFFSQWFPGLAFGLGAQQIHPVFCILYLAVAGALFLQNPRHMIGLFKAPFAPPPDSPPEAGNGPHCMRCKWRLAAARELNTVER